MLDARLYQIAFLGCFLLMGVGTRDWSLQSDVVATAFISCLSTQAVLSYYLLPVLGNRPRWKSVLNSLPSGAITSLALTLLLRTNSPLSMALAGGMAIASKFWLRAPEGPFAPAKSTKHFFNPANFGIIIALLFTRDSWVSPGQWGTDWWAVMAFAVAGGLVLKRVGRWDTSITFLSLYTGLEILRNAWLGWEWEVTFHHLTSGSLLLFAFFMLTDPRSIPNARPARITWAAAIAVLTFVLRYLFFIPTAMFWALFVLSPAIVMLDQYWPARRFQWNEEQDKAQQKEQSQRPSRQLDVPQLAPLSTLTH